MDSSDTIIANLALAHIGVTKQIAMLSTDRSQEGNSCRQFYQIAVAQVMSDFWWSFATKFAVLALVSERPTCEYLYSYTYPADCLDARRILSGIRNDNRQTRVTFKVVEGPSGNLIYTDKECAELEYTTSEVDSSRYNSDFKMAVSLYLARLIAPALTKGDPFGLIQKMEALYDKYLSNAERNVAREEQIDQEPESEFIRARGGNCRSERWPWQQ